MTTKPAKKESGAPNVTPVMQQYLGLKEKFPNEVLFFRLGDFYELFFDDAIKASPVMEVALTQRQSIPMCGVPHHAVTGYLAKLLKAGLSVALAEQMEDPKKTKGMVRRDVVRVMTPGTIVEEELLSAKRNNFLVAVAAHFTGRLGSEHWALVATDVSTGKQWTGELDGDRGWNSLKSQLAALSPTEVLLVGEVPPRFREELDFSGNVRLEPVPAGANGLLAQVSQSIHSFLSRHHAAVVPVLQDPEPLPLEENGILFLDQTAIRHLELVDSLNSGETGPTLLSALDKTVTPMGSRLMRWSLVHPSTDLEEINQRHDILGDFYDAPEQRDGFRNRLRDGVDIERLSVRIQTGRVAPRELGSLRRTLEKVIDVQRDLTSAAEQMGAGALAQVIQNLAVPENVLGILRDKLADDPPIKISDGGVIREGVNDELDNLRQLRRSGKSWIAQMEKEQKDITGITNLKVGYNDVFGYFLEVSKSHLAKVPADWIRKQTLANSERYFTPSLKEYEEKILNAEGLIETLETQLFNQVVESVAAFGADLGRISSAIAKLDVAAALAEVASLFGWVRPTMSNGRNLVIQAGRHPVVEKQIGRDRFIPNKLEMANGQKINIITGPNMAGKSTYLRQTALIVILAQMGSYVPADLAEIGIVDRIFTRIGASDRLAQGQSTFMVEMQEVATLLANATPRSLLILDEVGRGTSTYDGMSIAWAVIEFLSGFGEASKKNTNPQSPRTLFATHYFELTQLENSLPNVFNSHATAKEWPGEGGSRRVVFLYQIAPGAADRSYGIHVAEMAGLPEKTIHRAREILHRLETGRHDTQANEAPGSAPSIGSGQMEFFGGHPILEQIKKLDANQMTPIEALSVLADIIRKVKQN